MIDRIRLNLEVLAAPIRSIDLASHLSLDHDRMMAAIKEPGSGIYYHQTGNPKIWIVSDKPRITIFPRRVIDAMRLLDDGPNLECLLRRNGVSGQTITMSLRTGIIAIKDHTPDGPMLCMTPKGAEMMNDETPLLVPPIKVISVSKTQTVLRNAARMTKPKLIGTYRTAMDELRALADERPPAKKFPPRPAPDSGETEDPEITKARDAHAALMSEFEGRVMEATALVHGLASLLEERV